MSTEINRMLAWAQKGTSLPAQSWDQMPDIYLYMDQVITCLQDMLQFYDADGKNPLITSSMINNYVKNGVVNRPVKKKYDRGHLSRLYMICMLKQVLSMQEIDSLLNGEEDPQALFSMFSQIAADAVHTESERTVAAGKAGKDELWKLALHLSAEAAAKQVAARRIIDALEADKTHREETK